MKAINRAKRAPEIGHSGERLIEDRKFKPKEKTQAGTVVCQRCGAIGMHKHWFADRRLYERVSVDPLTRTVICPGCKREEDKLFEGEVILDSPLLAENKEMVYGTIYHTAARAFHDNPLSRIAVIEESAGQIRLLTTTCCLAERLGKAFHKAMKGELKIKPSKAENFVIVEWRRKDS